MADHVAIVSCQRARGLDTDEPLLLAALHALGIGAHVLDWDQPADWTAYDLAVLRSTWDYAKRHAEFLTWAAEVSDRTRLRNSPAMLAWNTDKRYLSELSAAGLPVIDTTFLAPGTPWLATELSHAVVVKPSVSAGGQDTWRYAPGQLSQAHDHVTRLHAQQRVVIVQPYLDAVEVSSETALIYIGGAFSHAAAKSALLCGGATEPGLFAPETVSPRTPSAAERALGDATMAWLGRSAYGPPLYARVDLLPDADGCPRILELELTEPSLFLETDPDAAGRLATAIRVELDQ